MIPHEILDKFAIVCNQKYSTNILPVRMITSANIPTLEMDPSMDVDLQIFQVPDTNEYGLIQFIQSTQTCHVFCTNATTATETVGIALAQKRYGTNVTFNTNYIPIKAMDEKVTGLWVTWKIDQILRQPADKWFSIQIGLKILQNVIN